MTDLKLKKNQNLNVSSDLRITYITCYSFFSVKYNSLNLKSPNTNDISMSAKTQEMSPTKGILQFYFLFVFVSPIKQSDSLSFIVSIRIPFHLFHPQDKNRVRGSENPENSDAMGIPLFHFPIHLLPLPRPVFYFYAFLIDREIESKKKKDEPYHQNIIYLDVRSTENRNIYF